MWTSKGTPAKALVYTILLSAMTHLVITLFTALFTGMPDKANMFVVLGFNLIWPELGTGGTSALFGVVTVVLIWVVVFTVMQMHKRKKPTKKTTHETTV
jgi:Na+/melibiose symporter-like transporter